MLRCFFECGCRSELFEGLEISRAADYCKKYMGRFPVISITLKGVSAMDFLGAKAMLRTVIGNEAMRFLFLKESPRLSEDEKESYRQLAALDSSGRQKFSMSDDMLADSLYTLSKLLRKHYGQKVILLIDEYDVPLDKARHYGYYDEMVTLIRNLFGTALKTNDSLQFAVLTGCLRIAKESIFTGLNNLNVFSVTDVRFASRFGFTSEDVRQLLGYYHLEDKFETIRKWYDGYRFGDTEVYCPWDVINYVDLLRTEPAAFPRAYWINTSGNDIIRKFIRMATPSTRREIEALVAGETVTHRMRQELTYRELYDNIKGTTPYCVKTVAVLNCWGKARSWGCHMVHHALYQKQNYSYAGVIEALSGAPFDVQFISFDDLKEDPRLLDHVDVLLTVGDGDTAHTGGAVWEEPEVSAAVKRFVWNGGGFLGVGEPSGHQYQGRYFQLAGALGVEKETGFTLGYDKYNWEEHPDHFILADTTPGEVDFGEGQKGIYALEGAQVLIQHDREVQMAANGYGQGRAVYLSGLPYSFENSRLLHRAILWAAHGEDALHCWFSSNLNVEVHAFPANGKYCAVNNTYEPQSTTVYRGDGSSFPLDLASNEIRWYEI